MYITEVINKSSQRKNEKLPATKIGKKLGFQRQYHRKNVFERALIAFWPDSGSVYVTSKAESRKTKTPKTKTIKNSKANH